MRNIVAAIALAMLMMPSHALAWDDLHEWAEPYRQRVEGVTVGAGDAKAVNSAAHIIDPWPPYVGNRRIPGNGERMVGAVGRYKDVKKLKEAAPTLAPEVMVPGGAAP